MCRLATNLRPGVEPAIKLSDVTVPVVEQFKVNLRQAGRSPIMVRKVLVSLGSIIAYAQAHGLVARNAVRDMRKGRGDKRHKRKLEVGVDIPTPQEVSTILHHAPERWRGLLFVAAFCGLRASELRGLHWEDVDFVSNELTVRQRADRYGKLGDPKSGAGQRTLKFSTNVANTLRPRYEQAGGVGLAFPTSKGTIVEHKNLVTQALLPALMAANLRDKDGNLKYTGLHALRHFYASWCINRREAGGLGLDPKDVQKRMGHSSIVITLDTYSHLFPSDDAEGLDEAVDALMSLHTTQTRHAS